MSGYSYHARGSPLAVMLLEKPRCRSRNTHSADECLDAICRVLSSARHPVDSDCFGEGALLVRHGGPEVRAQGSDSLVCLSAPPATSGGPGEAANALCKRKPCWPAWQGQVQGPGHSPSLWALPSGSDGSVPLELPVLPTTQVFFPAQVLRERGWWVLQ